MPIDDFVTSALGHAEVAWLMFDADLPRGLKMVGGRRLGKAAESLQRTRRGEASSRLSEH